MSFVEIISFSEKKNNYENTEYEHYNEHFSDTENELSNIKEFNDEELFLLHYTDDLLDIFHDIKNRFALNPDFLSKLKTTIFVDFITHYVLYGNESSEYYIKDTKNITKDIIYFQNIFYNELNISYNLIHSFTQLFKIKLCLQKWTYFCYKNTYIPLNYID